MKMTKKIKKKRQKRGKKITIKKKKQITEKKKKVIEFLKEYGVFILCAVLLYIAISKERYEVKMLSGNTESVVAEVIEIWPDRKGWNLRYKYFFNGKECVGTDGISKEEYTFLNVGDCIEVKVSLIDEKVVRWNREKGKFQCP